MSRVVADSNAFGGDLASAVGHLFNFRESVDKFMFPSLAHHANENKGMSNIPVDILDTPKDYIFYMDVPGVPKSDIQVPISFPPHLPHVVFFVSVRCGRLIFRVVLGDSLNVVGG
jgi:hypothetical protein